ncbi:MAG: hypothetical protein LRZ88_09295 [Candidatus Cloacimonetes bacterium]|nr:hypothetical protein [Candidatus Cloacimonadota bacterium]
MDTFYRNFCSLMGVSPRTDKGEKYVHYLKYIYEFTSQYVITDQELLALADRHIPQDAYPDVDRLILAQDIVFRMLGKDSLVGRDNLDHINIVEEDMKKARPEVHLTQQFKPQNLILYGPPGTGKTYHSINKALEIVDPGFMKAPRDRTQITERYRELVDEGRIVFTTFHQSMSYEDFIEGIKPIPIDEQGNNLSYEVEAGIFKHLCRRAAMSGHNNFYSAYTRFMEDIAGKDEKQLSLTTPFGAKFVVRPNSNDNLTLILGNEGRKWQPHPKHNDILYFGGNSSEFFQGILFGSNRKAEE